MPSGSPWRSSAPIILRCRERAIQPIASCANVRSSRARIRPGCHGLRLKCNTGQRRTRTRAGWVGRNCSCRGGRAGVQRLIEIGGGLVAGVHRFVETDSGSKWRLSRVGSGAFVLSPHFRDFSPPLGDIRPYLPTNFSDLTSVSLSHRCATAEQPWLSRGTRSNSRFISTIFYKL